MAIQRKVIPLQKIRTAVMQERVWLHGQEKVPVAALEALLQQRIGWVDCAISPFAVATRNARIVTPSPKQPALPAPISPSELRLAG
jgi:hypothetical protein